MACKGKPGAVTRNPGNGKFERHRRDDGGKFKPKRK